MTCIPTTNPRLHGYQTYANSNNTAFDSFDECHFENLTQLTPMTLLALYCDRSQEEE
jgi:hypothetical protein